MTVPQRLQDFAADLTAIRRDLHAHPELGFQEVRTAGIVAAELERLGIAVTRGIATTGVVGVLEGRRPGRTIGLRADMDALPIEERTNLPFASKTPGVMHACGHDTHTTMLLGAARYLAETRDFAGTAVFVFQPAEEGLGGARAMIAEGLFERFPCDEIYAIHNSPMHAAGTITLSPGPTMAGANFFDITVTGRGAHAAMPAASIDTVMIAAGLVGQIQTIVSRNLDPGDRIVVSVTRMQAGTAYNVIPETATLAGTVRYFNREAAAKVTERMRAICDGAEAAFGCTVTLEMRNVFDVLENDPALTGAMAAAAGDLVGEAASVVDMQVMGSEDFADMLQVVPGAYCWLGHGGGVAVHNPGFVFDDAFLPLGAALLARMVETRGAP